MRIAEAWEKIKEIEVITNVNMAFHYSWKLSHSLMVSATNQLLLCRYTTIYI